MTSKRNTLFHNNELARCLYSASSEGDEAEVLKLLAEGAFYQSIGPIGMNPLHISSQNGYLDISKILVSYGIPVDSVNKVAKTPLHFAAMNGHEGIVEYLVSFGAAIDPLDIMNMTPLHWACERGYLGIAKFLLENGANPNLLNNFKRSPFHLVDKTHKDVLIKLVESNNFYDEMTYSKRQRKNSTSCIPMNGVLEREFHVSDHNCNSKDHRRVNSFVNIRESDDIEDITDRVGRNSLSDFNFDSSSDDETGSEDKLLNTLNDLEKLVPTTKLSGSQLDSIFSSSAADLLKAEASLVPPEDPSLILRRAIYYGKTICLTEAGQMALAMVKPDPLIIPHDKEDEEKKEQNTTTRGSSSKVPHFNAEMTCNAVVLHNKNSSRNFIQELSKCNNSRPPPLKRNKI